MNKQKRLSGALYSEPAKRWSRGRTRKMPAVAYRRDPDIHSGAAVFEGTRVAVWVLFNWLAAGKSLDEFLAAHPQVDRDTADAVLDDASRALVGQSTQGE